MTALEYVGRHRSTAFPDSTPHERYVGKHRVTS